MLSTALFPWPLRRLTSPSVLSGQGSIASGLELKGEGMLLVCSDSGHHLIHSEQYLFTLPSALQLCLVVIRVKALLAGVSKATPPPMSGGDFSEPGLQGHHYPLHFLNHHVLFQRPHHPDMWAFKCLIQWESLIGGKQDTSRICLWLHADVGIALYLITVETKEMRVCRTDTWFWGQSSCWIFPNQGGLWRLITSKVSYLSVP